MVSYAGQVQFGVVADDAVLGDPSAFLADCVAELKDFPGES
ncbi:MAG TPA: WS/DGAT domain-containing protein [Marinobacter sp.]|nr:WS/DGAT domain-containing protein [Marinobacter sp.]